MFIGFKPQFVFIDVPKTGSRSILQYLKKNISRFEGIDGKTHQVEIEDKYRDFFTFLTVRDPYERACSSYWSQCMRIGDRYKFKEKFNNLGLENTFNNFLLITLKELQETGEISAHASWRQCFFISSNKIDFIMKFERLEKDFYNLPFVSDNDFLPDINKTTSISKENNLIRPSFDEMADDISVKLINEIYEEDFKALEKLGYYKL
jgi:hypothetical protein